MTPTHALFGPLPPTTHFRSRLESSRNSTGFTLIELMIVIAVLAILVSIAVPVYNNYTVRAKIAEGLSVGNGAKTATGASCQEDPTLTALNNNAVGYAFIEDTNKRSYVESVEVTGECTEPVVVITMKNTGTPELEEPVVVLTGSFSDGGQILWVCASSNTSNHLLPKECRS